ncbi:MAG: hypothetical protein KIT87_12055, partial [Anaerolineae bacterium]|nr:hypothetical protein [Anaerolineae bacterium]
SHDSLFSLPLRNGNALKFFLDPTAVSLNYLKTRADADGFPRYQDYNMIGLSGGGWTTTLYAAVDPTIKTSIPVAGTLPLYLRYDGYNHDLEQTLSSFYSRAGYPDLYVLGSYGRGRKQVQVLNRRDNCCFGEAEHRVSPTGMTWEQAVRDYEARVRLALYNIGAYQGYGSFRVEIDEAAPAHMISWNAIVNTILPELNGGRRYSGAVGRDAFYRGVNGHLWHNSPSGETDTGLPMVGAPATLQGVLYSFDVFYRDPSNRLMRAFRTTAGWTARSMGRVIISDPAVVSSGPGHFDVVAFGSDYRLYQWSGTPSGDSPPRQIGGSAIGQGTPSLVTRGPNQLDVFFRGFDRSVYHLQTSDGTGWSIESVGGISLDFPSSVVLPDGSLRVYARGQDSQLWEARPVKGSPWQWASVSGQTGGQTVHGSPSAAIQDGLVRVHVRTASNTLATFAYSGRWTFTSYFSLITGSPTATSAGAFVRNGDASLAFYYGTGGDWRGGIFD